MAAAVPDGPAAPRLCLLLLGAPWGCRLQTWQGIGDGRAGEHRDQALHRDSEGGVWGQAQWDPHSPLQPSKRIRALSLWGNLHWGPSALVLTPGCFTAAQDPPTWGNLRLLSSCSSPRPFSPQMPQTPQQPHGSPKPLSTVAAQEPPVSQYLRGQRPCSLVPAQGPTAPKGCHQLTLTGESPKSWCWRVTLQGLARLPALPS